MGGLELGYDGVSDGRDRGLHPEPFVAFFKAERISEFY